MTVHFTTHCKIPSARINRKLLQRRTAWLMRQNRVAAHEVSILLVDDEEISWLNSHYRNKQGPTNVLSFPFADATDPTLGTIPVYELGDIIISVETALREANELNISFHDRLTWLITHGLLHLLGHDHERSEEEAVAMWDLENKLIMNFYKVTGSTVMCCAGGRRDRNNSKKPKSIELLIINY